MDASGHYVGAANARGVWVHQLLSTAPFFPIADVVTEIAAVSVATGVPLTAYARSTSGRITSSLLLVRDPSITHGTPDIADCERAAAALAARGNWVSQGQDVRSCMLLALGLREGYDPAAARVHTWTEVTDPVLGKGEVWCGWPAELISARPQPDGTAQVYHEPGVLAFTDFDQLPTLTAIAFDLRQDRLVIHNWLTGWTTAYRRGARSVDT
ncbi:hypothetical protein [Amycolatopsis sp. CA-126428]|uniref:hypothetical protein n=1 Tax=Amycolatopsis sp. CA-126428 TaxID=2073158 RepID=UPI000CD1E922|nr:hypothetical protein [Amycolatopsis sp. CA-126428]